MKLISSDKSKGEISDKANKFIIKKNDNLIFSFENKSIKLLSILYLFYI
jgi:hypothetical protein